MAANPSQTARHTDPANGANSMPPGPSVTDGNERRVSFPQVLAVPFFRQELPQLLKDYPGQWAAYQGNRRLGIARTKTKLYREGIRQGLTPGEFEIFCIEPEMPDPV